MKSEAGGNFGQCRSCGARIMWIKTKSGKNMPVDPQFVDYRKVAGGKERLVTPTGDVVAGERCKAEKQTATVTYPILLPVRDTENHK